MLVICEYCSKEFNKKPSRVAITKHHYCSAECRNKGSKQTKKTGKTVQCKECDRDVYKNPSELKKSKNGNHFCGRSCAQTYYGKTHRGENHPNYVNGEGKYRDYAFRELDHKCNRCEFDSYTSILQVHHKDHDRQNNDIDNLEILCPNCHMIEHIEDYKGTMNKPLP